MSAAQIFIGSARLWLGYSSVACIIMFTFMSSSWGAYCSLRDPIVAINSLFPESNKYQSIVRTVGLDVRNNIARSLPFTLHFNELGRHTLFVPQKNNSPLGFVHARSESSEWGLVEIAWGLTLGLKIEGFYFQRCRSSSCNDQLLQALSKDLRGKSIVGVRKLLSADGSTLSSLMASKYSSNRALVLSVVRSALKTIAATEHGWNEDIIQLRNQAVTMQSLNIVNPPDLQPVTSQHRDKISIAAAYAPMYAFVDKSSIKAWRVIDNDVEVARIVNATWRHAEKTGEFSWLFSLAGEVLSIENHGPMPDTDTAFAFNQLLGKDLSNPKNCVDGAALAGNALYLSAYKNIKVNKNED